MTYCPHICLYYVLVFDSATAELKIEDLCEDILNLDLNDENRNRQLITLFMHSIETHHKFSL